MKKSLNNMRAGFITTILVLIYSHGANSQIVDEHHLDSLLAKKITIAGFVLCNTSVADLKKIDGDLTEVPVEEMDICKSRFTQDSRFVNWRGYSSTLHPGMIFQKENDSDLISKIRLTKEFIGLLPDGNHIDVNKLTAGEVLKMYPELDTWKSRGCSDYWNLTNDTLSFFVKIDKNKVPQYPVDEAYYRDKPIEGIDLVISCYSVSNKRRTISLFNENDPLFFLDSIRVNRGVLNRYQPAEFSFLNVYKGENAIRVAGSDAKNGAVYIITKEYARTSYWNYFKSKSVQYSSLVTDLDKESKVVYILNDKKLEGDFEKDLFVINDETLVELSVEEGEISKRKRKGSTPAVVVRISTKPNSD